MEAKIFALSAEEETISGPLMRVGIELFFPLFWTWLVILQNSREPSLSAPILSFIDWA